MKISSIIFIIIGVIAIVSGMLLCSSAEDAALTDGYNLHQGIFGPDGNITNTHSFSLDDDVDISKISIDLADVDVQVIGGAEKSEIVCENLYPGTYAYTVSNKVVSITNILDTSNILDALSNIEFNGIRNFLDTEILKDREKKVYIYINEESEIIKQISFNLVNCNINVKNITGSLDFRIKAENSNLSFSDCSTDSSVYCNIESSSLDFVNFEFNRSEFILNESKLNFNSTLVILYRFDINSDKSFVVNSEQFDGSYTLSKENESYPLVKIDGINSDIKVEYLG